MATPAAERQSRPDRSPESRSNSSVSVRLSKDSNHFIPSGWLIAILGMGDVLTLIEKAEETFDQVEAEKAAVKMQKGQFTLEDFLEQFQALKRMGPLKDVLAMLPGSGSLLKQVNIEDRDLARVEGSSAR